MKKFTLTDGAALVVLLIPIIYLYFVYDTLPAIVPTHFDASGKPNGFSTRHGFIGVEAMLTGIALLTYLLLKFLPLIDPKQQVKYGESTYQKIAIGIVMFLCAINIAIIYAAMHNSFNMGKMLFPLMGLLLAFLGNMMNSIKPNYFVGIRTPWTLEDEPTWRATHRFAAKFWLAGGLLITIIALVVKGKYSLPFIIPAILILAFVPIIYSYIYYKNHRPA